MKTLKAEFIRLTALSIVDTFGAIGLYVLWDGRALARPTYIGEGNLLKRLATHDGNFAEPLDGYACVLEAATRQRSKADAEIVEALLIWVARETDRAPAVNVASGKLRGLDAIFRRHGTLRLSVSGYDPLQPPWTARPMARSKWIVLRDDGGEALAVEHDWRRRRKLL